MGCMTAPKVQKPGTLLGRHRSVGTRVGGEPTPPEPQSQGSEQWPWVLGWVPAETIVRREARLPSMGNAMARAGRR